MSRPLSDHVVCPSACLGWTGLLKIATWLFFFIDASAQGHFAPTLFDAQLHVLVCLSVRLSGLDRTGLDC